MDIVCIQEAHCELESIGKWEGEWGGKIIASHGTNNSKGTCILLNKNWQYEILDHKESEEGRYVIISFRVYEEVYKVASYYGPNQDDPTCITEMLSTIEQMEGEHTIVVGDFNFVMDINQDKEGGNPVTNFKNR